MGRFRLYDRRGKLIVKTGDSVKIRILETGESFKFFMKSYRQVSRLKKKNIRVSRTRILLTERYRNEARRYIKTSRE